MKIRNLTRIAMLVALTVALSLIVIIPIPATNGFVTLCEVGIYSASLFLGPLAGFLVGAFSGGMIDLLSGYPQWMIFSFVIHGLQGLTLGFIYRKWPNFKGMLIGFTLASLVMITGYALATALLYTWPAGLISIPSNLVQNIFGIAVTMVLYQSLNKVFSKLQYH